MKFFPNDKGILTQNCYCWCLLVIVKFLITHSSVAKAGCYFSSRKSCGNSNSIYVQYFSNFKNMFIETQGIFNRSSAWLVSFEFPFCFTRIAVPFSLKNKKCNSMRYWKCNRSIQGFFGIFFSSFVNGNEGRFWF